MENIGASCTKKEVKQSRKERKKITTKARLLRKLAHDERPYKCKECPKEYANHGTLYRHKTTHSDVKNYKCDMCGICLRTIELNCLCQCAYTLIVYTNLHIHA